MPSAPDFRLLVACRECQRQYDASGLAGGSRFRCSCGELVAVPEAKPHDAAVVRCSSCGAPREEGGTSCKFCGSDFTLHERDLHTLCPTCMTRISDRSRFCHSCGLTISPQESAGEPTDKSCPVCGESSPLRSRRLGGEQLSVLECGTCAGLWLGSQVFRLLEQRAQVRETEEPPPSDPTRNVPVTHRDAPLYRPCVECGKLMNRRNYGRKSGVILDVCSSDGIWFDPGELDAVLRWVEEGGLAQARIRTEEERRGAERIRSLSVPALDQQPTVAGAGGRGWTGFVGSLIDFLLSVR